MHNQSDVAAKARSLALRIVWDHWDSLGYLAPEPAGRPRNSLVDPEALLLLTILVQSDDSRLDDVIEWWMESGIELWSLQRLRRMLSMFPQPVRESFARSAAPVMATREARWARLATGIATGDTSRAGTASGAIQLLNPAALVLRSRLLLGVNPRSDVLIYLLSRGVDAATVREIAATTCFARSSVHQILRQLASSRLVIRKGKRPHRYTICTEAWQEVFGREAIRSGLSDRIGFRRLYGNKTAARVWLCWPQTFSLLAALALIDADPAVAMRASTDVRAIFRLYFEYERTFYEHRLHVQIYHGMDPRRFQFLNDCVDAVSKWYTAQA